MINELLIYDLETNGFFEGNPNPLPIEIAAIHINPDGVVAINELISEDLSDTPILITDKITEITGITNEQLSSDGKPLRQVLAQFAPTMNADLIIGHNIVRFDNLFIKNLLNIDLFNKTFDTAGEFKSRKIGWNKFAKASFADFHSKVLDVRRRGLKYNLDIACEECNIPIRPNRHRAITDVIMTADLFLFQWARYDKSYTINPATIDKLRDYINDSKQ